MKADYLQLSQQFEELKKKADEQSLALFESQMKKQEAEEKPRDAQNVEIEEESPYGLGGGAYGPAYPSPQPFVRGEKQWTDNA